MFSTKEGKTSPGICTVLTTSVQRQVSMKQCNYYLTRLDFICWSVNILVCMCVCANVCACISRCLAPSCSRSFTSVLTLRPQRHLACRREVGWELVVLALAKHSVQAFLFFFGRATVSQHDYLAPFIQPCQIGKVVQLPAFSESKISEISV